MNKQNNNFPVYLFFAEFFQSQAFFGLLTVLILYLSHQPLFEDLAYTIWGGFAALVYIAALFGSVVAEKYLTYRLASLLGFILMIVGFVILSLGPSSQTLLIGLNLIACGNGLAAPNLRNLLGLYFDGKSSNLRDNAFTTFHVFNVVGQATGPLLLTYFQLINPNYMFIVAAGSTLISFILFLVYSNKMPFQTNPVSRKSIAAGITLVICFISLTFILSKDIKQVLEILLMCLLLFITFKIIKLDSAKRIKILTILIIIAGLIIAEVCFRQISSIFNIFTDQYVDRKGIPTGYFQAIDPFFICALFPLFILFRRYLERKHKRLTAGTSISIGLVGLAIAFLLLGSAAFGLDLDKVSFYWLIICYFFMAISELLIVPIAQSSITEFAPENWHGILMGLLFLSASIASYIDSALGNLINSNATSLTKIPELATYQHLFFEMTGIAFFAGLLLLIIWKVWLLFFSKVLFKNDRQ